MYILLYIYVTTLIIDQAYEIERLTKRNKYLREEARRAEEIQKLVQDNKALTERLRRVVKKVTA